MNRIFIAGDGALKGEGGQNTFLRAGEDLIFFLFFFFTPYFSTLRVGDLFVSITVSVTHCQLRQTQEYMWTFVQIQSHMVPSYFMKCINDLSSRPIYTVYNQYLYIIVYSDDPLISMERFTVHCFILPPATLLFWFSLMVSSAFTYYSAPINFSFSLSWLKNKAE